MVLVHGFGANRRTWVHLAPDLARDHLVHVVELKGAGDAPKPRDDRYSPIDQAELLVRWLRARALESAVLVGHSLGGGIALMAALLLKDSGEDHRIERLVLISAAAYPQQLPRYIGLARVPGLGRLGLALLPTRWLVRRILREITYDPASVTHEQAAAYANTLSGPGAARAIVKAAQQVTPPQAEALVTRYPEITQPTLVLWGQQDPVTPLANGYHLQRDLPNSRLVILEDCGHLPPEERPLETAAEVRRFLRA